MTLKRLIIAIVCCLLLTGIQSAFAASDAIKTMAGIMMGLNHYPSDAEKGTLRELSMAAHLLLKRLWQRQ